MGVVWKARHTRTGELAALKTLRLTASSLRAGLRRELELLERLHHPDIVRLLDADLDAQTPWIAMSWVEGTALVSRVSDAATPAQQTWDGEATLPAAPVPRGTSLGSPGESGGRTSLSRERVQEVLDLACRLCTPLAWLHGQGQVHRDLKPGNVLVSPQGRPVLLDFGIASVVRDRHGRDELILGRGTSAGTSATMAPEQIRGELVDARTDLYALGCVLFMMLTGRGPFVGSVHAVLHGHCHQLPPAVSSLVDGAPPALEALIGALLEKEPTKRIPYATDVARALVAAGARPDTEPRPAPRPYVHRAALAGRRAEWAALTEPLRADPVAGFRLILGESGSGKTRLALELCRDARRRGLAHVTGVARPDGGLLHVWEPILGQLGVEQPEPPADLPPKARRRHRVEGLAAALVERVGRSPLVVLLDDLQWADGLSMDLAKELVERQPAGLLLVGTARIEEMSPRVTALAALTEPLRLGRLLPDHVCDLVQHMLALPEPARRFSRRLFEHTEGNPLFVGEMLRAAVEAGSLTRSEGVWRVEAPDGPVALDVALPAVPSSVRELLAQRLDALPADARRLAVAGALLGRTFEPAIAEQVLPVADRTLALAELLRARILESDAGRMRFTHDMLREVASALVGTEAQAAHSRAADALAAQGESASKLDVARHLELAGRGSEALAIYRAERVQREQAGDLDGMLAASWGVVRLTPQDSPELAKEHFDYANRCRRADQDRVADEHYEHAIRLATARGQRRVRLRALLSMGRNSTLSGSLAEGEARVREALADIDAGVEPDLLPMAMQVLGTLLLNQGRVDEARQVLERGVAAARTHEAERELGLCSVALGLVAERQRRPDDAVRWYDLAIHACSDLDSHELAWGNLGLIHLAREDLVQARAAFEAALAVTSRLRLAYATARHSGNLAEVDLREGRVQDARDRLEASVRAFRKGGQLRAEAYFLGQWARARRLCGEPPERIRPSLVRALELGEISGDRYYGLVPEVELLLLRALSGSPPLDEARDLLARAAEQGAVPDPAGTLVDRAIARLEEAMHAWAAT